MPFVGEEVRACSINSPVKNFHSHTQTYHQTYSLRANQSAIFLFLSPLFSPLPNGRSAHWRSDLWIQRGLQPLRQGWRRSDFSFLRSFLPLSSPDRICFWGSSHFLNLLSSDYFLLIWWIAWTFWFWLSLLFLCLGFMSFSGS